MDVKKGRLLIVDDEPDITNYFSLALEGSVLFEVDPYNDSLKRCLILKQTRTI